MISALITGIMIPKWYDKTRPLPDFIIEEYSWKYGRPVFLVLNIIYGIKLVMEM